MGNGLLLYTDIKEGVPKTSFICFLNHLDSYWVTSCPISSGCVSSLFAGWKRRQQASVFLCACPPGRPAAGEPSTGGPLRQPAGPREGPGGGRRGRQAGAVVHINGFPVQREGKGELDSFLAATAGMASWFLPWQCTYCTAKTRDNRRFRMVFCWPLYGFIERTWGMSYEVQKTGWERRGWHAAPGRESNPGLLQRGQSLCTWDARSTHWAKYLLVYFHFQYRFHKSKEVFYNLFIQSYELSILFFNTFIKSLTLKPLIGDKQNLKLD